MKDLPGKKLNKKGFTLAELLIVVAIIAILIAIALPLFFGAMDNAEKARDDANIRSVKAAAVNEIFSNPELQMVPLTPNYLAEWWSISAHIDKEGNITLDKIEGFSQYVGADGAPLKPSDFFPDECKWDETNQLYNITCTVFSTDVDYTDY